jgi:hypothetical protein
MGIMNGRFIRTALTRGGIIPTLSVTAKNGKHPTKVGKPGIHICAALTL